jgi:hypothetical protein
MQSADIAPKTANAIVDFLLILLVSFFQQPLWMFGEYFTTFLQA